MLYYILGPRTQVGEGEGEGGGGGWWPWTLIYPSSVLFFLVKACKKHVKVIPSL